jgi:AbrB family looped-hinge helix DNA binding protein
MKVTTKGQVTIPASIRDYLGILPHTQVDFRVLNGSVVLSRAATRSGGSGKFSALRGVLKGKRTTAEWMRDTRGT